jgi:hypothetical protein
LEHISEDGWTILLLAFAIFNFVFAIYALYQEMQDMIELNEYKNIGTVGGFKALKI